MKRYIFLTTLFLSFSSRLLSINIWGSTLTAYYLGSGNNYSVIYTYYRDCFGMNAPLTKDVYYLLNGSTSGPVTLNQTTTWMWASTLSCYNPPVNCANGQG